MKKFLAAAFLAGIVGGSGSVEAAGVAVTVTPEGPNQYRIELQTHITASREAVWNVLTDYNHHAQRLPYITKSHITQHTDSYRVVEQEGKIRVLFWTFVMHVTQQVTQTPPGDVKFHAIAGDFERLEGTWHLDPAPETDTPARQGTHLGCQFMVQPKRRVPEWAVRFTARRYLSKMVQALADHAGKVRP